MFTFIFKHRNSITMSRKFLFMLILTVMMLYFCVILFMLHPLQTRSYVGNISFRSVPNVDWCKELKFRSPPSSTVSALVSYPGSGNTWLRYLLQQVTGLMTGSIYMDHGLRLHGFPGENVTDGSVLVVKTHEMPPIGHKKFHSAILLIRNPRDAILADFNRLHKGHIGTAPKSAFTKKTHEKKMLDWPVYVSMQLTNWEALHRLWLTKFKGPIHIVFYEMLVRDVPNTMHGILQFLKVNYTEIDMACALYHREGIYRRRKKLKDFDPFTTVMYQALFEVRTRVLNMVNDYQKARNLTVFRY